jgi:ABC-type transporter Mla MlaB component
MCGSRVISPHGPQPRKFGDEPPLYDDGALRIIRLPGPGPGFALTGEIDEAAFPALARRLGEIAADLDEVHLNLAALDYTDLAGLRVIVGLADAGRRGVVLHQVPPHLRAILNIVGWDTAPGVQVAS